MNGASPPPRVTACVPTWNAEPFIARTLAALAAQDYPNLVILISDDASSDRTAEICRRTAGLDPRFRVIVQPRRLGWVGNCNALLQSADGAYAFFAPHDDSPAPNYVSRMVPVLERDPSVSLAFGDVEILRGDRHDEIATFPLLEGVRDRARRAQRVIGHNLARNRWFVPYRGVFRLPAARAFGGLRVHRGGEFAADWLWALDLALQGEVRRVPGVSYVKHFEMAGHAVRLARTRRPWNWLGVFAAAATGVCRARLGRFATMRILLLLAARFLCFFGGMLAGRFTRHRRTPLRPLDAMSQPAPSDSPPAPASRQSNRRSGAAEFS